jgi:hypothetical protein
MMTSKQLAALIGFGFVAIWIAFGFGEAILCLLGAVVFYAAVLYFQGGLDFADLQSRLSRREPMYRRK